MYSLKDSKFQLMPFIKALRSMPSTTERFFIMVSRCSAGQGVIPKPQLPITTVVTPSPGEGDNVGSHVTCASKWVCRSTIPGINARPFASTTLVADPSTLPTLATTPSFTATSAMRPGLPKPSKTCACRIIKSYIVISPTLFLYDALRLKGCNLFACLIQNLSQNFICVLP